MRITILLAATLLLAACDNAQTATANRYEIVVIEECQYIVVENGYRGMNNYSYAITHKGNCTNPIHETRH